MIHYIIYRLANAIKLFLAYICKMPDMEGLTFHIFLYSLLKYDISLKPDVIAASVTENPPELSKSLASINLLFRTYFEGDIPNSDKNNFLK